VQARVLSEPEFDPLRAQAIATPKWRTRHRLTEKTRFGLGDARLEHFARSDHLALRRRPSADLTAALAPREIAIGPGLGRSLDAPLDAHLAVQASPKKDQRRMRVLLQLLAFVAAIVADEAQGSVAQALVKHGARRRASVRRGGRERHCVREARVERPSFGKPAFEHD